MTLNDAEVNLILACLRLQSMLYDNRAKEAARAHKDAEAAKLAVFARACGELSEKIDKQRPNRTLPRGLIIPNKG